MDHASSVPESEKLLGIAANLLCDGDFSSCRKFATIARDYDPYSPVPDRILAVADVLLAAKSQNPTDWYSILQIARPNSGNRRLIRAQFEKLTALLNPNDNGFPFSDEAFQLVQNAWSALSDPEKNTHFGNGPKKGPESPKQREAKQQFEGNVNNCEGGYAGETFWTVCPYCYAMFEYKKMFEDCCLRCQICWKAFHGVAIKAPSPEIMVKGKDQYYFTYGYFPMEYKEDPEKNNEDPKERGMEVNDKKDQGITVVEISDDDEEEEEEVVNNLSGEAKFWSEGKSTVKRMKAPARRMKGMKSKMVARSTKKIMGNGMSRRVGLASDEMVKELDLNAECGNRNNEGDGEIGDLKFFEGEDDIMVGFGDSP